MTQNVFQKNLKSEHVLYRLIFETQPWLRTPNPTNANNVRNVNTSGALNNNNANNTNGSAADYRNYELGQNE